MIYHRVGNIKTFLKRFYCLRHHWSSPVPAYQFLQRVHRKSTLSDVPVQLHLANLRFFVRPMDWFAFEEIILEQEYGFIRCLFCDAMPRIVIDVGANIGLFSIYALSVWPSIIIHSVEPSLRTYQVLERNRFANPELNWRTHRYAVWKTDGQVRFENREYSTSSRIGTEGIGDEVVPAISLTTLLSQHVCAPVDLMKMDIEGAEEAVLCGSETALRSVDRLVVEVHPQLCDQDWVIAVLRSTYDFLYRIPGRRSAKPLLLASHQPYPFPDYSLT